MSIPAGTLHPTSELVAVTWLRQVTGLDSIVATDVPADASTWAASGFVQVTGVAGSPHPELPVAQPVLSLDFWATNPDSGRPPWGTANQLAEHVRAGVHAHSTIRRRVTLPAAYADAVVMEALLLQEPRRIRGDAADLAHYTADLQLWWFEVPK